MTALQTHLQYNMGYHLFDNTLLCLASWNIFTVSVRCSYTLECG